MKNNLIILIVFLVVSACSTKKKLSTGDVPNRTKAEIYQSLVDRNIDFEWFSGKAKTQLDKRKFIRFSC